MRITKQTIPALVALTLAFAGCNQDENLPGGAENNNDRVAIRVSSNIDVTDGVMKKTITRVADNKWAENDQIGIIMLNGTEVDTYANIPYETASEDGNFAPLANGEVIYLPVDGSDRNFVAYYPYRDLTNDDTYGINLSDQSLQEDIDFMTAGKVEGINKTAPTVNFRFRHRLCKLRLTIGVDESFTGLSALEDLKVELTGQRTEGSYNVLTDDAMPTTKGNSTIELKTAANGQSAEAIVFPSEDFNDMQLKFYVKDETTPYTWDLTESKKAEKFEEGKEYIYNITIKKTGINVTATIEEWGEGNGEGETGDAE